MTTRYYTNTASQATLASGVGTTDTTITLTAGSYSGYPTSFPFSAAIARGTSSEELVLVTAASGNTLTVTRGYDSSTVSAHGAGSTFVHVITAQDMRDIQAAATAASNAQTTANDANTAAGAAQTAATTALNKYRGVADATARTALTGVDPDTLVLQESDQSLWAWIAGAWKQASSSGGGGTVTYDVQTFSTPGSYTWAKPAGALRVAAIVVGGGGGGQGAGGSSNNTAGGPGGGGGGYAALPSIDAATLGSTVSVVVGAGGAGGIGNTVSGVTGSSGGQSTFGSLVAAGGLGGGVAGTAPPGAGVGGAAGSPPGVGATLFTAGGGCGSNAGTSSGGGAGGPAPTGLPGGAGGAPGTSSTNASAGGNGSTPTQGAVVGSGGGGGGSYVSTAWAIGGAGGNGSTGCGGGGGGVTYSSGTGGKGGKGGDGVVVVVTECFITSVSTTAAPAIPLSSKGAPGGVATLDGNGQVPAAQLGNAPIVYAAVKKSGGWTTTSVNPVLDPDLSFANLPVGTYAINAWVIRNSTTAATFSFGGGTSVKTGSLAIIGSSGTNAYTLGTNATASNTLYSLGAPIQGQVTVTTAGSYGITTYNSSGTATSLDPGSFITLTKVG